MVPAVVISQLVVFLALGGRYVVREPGPFPLQRARILQELLATPDRHRVVVTYGRNH